MYREKLKEKLFEEKARLEGELKKISRKVDGDWEAKSTVVVDTADDTEMADKFEELSTNDSIVANLEYRLKEVNHAMDHIKNGTYGICETCGEKIEEDRLEANPAAKTCKAHM